MNDDKQFCTFYLEGHYFGLEVLRVQEVFKLQGLTEVPQADPAVSGLINLRGQIIVAIDLRQQLGLPPRGEDERPTCIVGRTEGGSVGILVDEIGDVLDPDEESFEEAPDTLPANIMTMVRGVYKLEKDLLLILNMDRAVEVGAAA